MSPTESTEDFADLIRRNGLRESQLDRVLTIFINVWVSLFVLLNVVGIAGQFFLHGFAAGRAYMQETYSPFNVANLVVTVISLSPAFGAYYWRENRRKRGRGPL